MTYIFAPDADCKSLYPVSPRQNHKGSWEAGSQPRTVASWFKMRDDISHSGHGEHRLGLSRWATRCYWGAYDEAIAHYRRVLAFNPVPSLRAKALARQYGLRIPQVGQVR